MNALTDSASMKDWYSRSTWTIYPGHVIGLEGQSPPSAMQTYDCIEERDPSIDAPWGGGELVSRDEYEELVDDLATAQRALEEYEDRGLGTTTSYSEYRTDRLERGL